MATAGRWTLAFALGGAALAVGSVHTVTICVVAAILALAVFLLWWDADPMNARPVATLLLLVGGGLTLWTALQCVPMPVGLLEAVAPYNASVWSRALAPLHEEGPRWVSLSLDPSATRIEVLKGTTYLLAFVAALRVARTKEGVGFLAMTTVLTGLALAVAAWLHPAFGAKRLFGIYEPGPGIAERHIAPLLNANNLAGYLALALCLALAACLSPRRPAPLPVLAAISIVLAATIVWIGSRGGIAAMVLGAAIVLAIATVQRSTERHRVAILSIVTVVLSCAGVVTIVLGTSDNASAELFDTDLSKFQLLGHMMRMVWAVPILGCGRGAFESVYPAFRSDAGYITFSHPENFVAQWTLEWGIPAGILGIMAITYALRSTAVLARSSSASGAWAGLIALSIQNLGDLGSEIPALVLVGVACAAIVVGGTAGQRPRNRLQRWARATRGVPLISLGVTAAALGAAATTFGTDLHADQRALYEAATVRRVSALAMRSIARDAMRRHPAEPYLPYAVALRAETARDENPLPWIGAAVERAAVYGPAHLLLARSLRARSPSQARLEYRLSMEQAPELVDTVMAEATLIVDSYDDATELIPRSPQSIAVKTRLSAQVRPRLPSTSSRFDETLISEGAAVAVDPTARRAEVAVEDVETAYGSPWCEGANRDGCVRDAIERARGYQTIAPGQCAGYWLEARARVVRGDPQALSVLVSAVDTVEDRVPCLRLLAQLARDTRDETHLAEALAQISSAGCTVDEECADNLAWVAAMEESRGHFGKAKALYERARDRAPGADELLEHIAMLAAKQGLHDEAASEYGELLRHHPDDRRWQQGVEREQRAAASDLLRQ
jgi:tetratricopeptide (TPR) repeat protein